MKRIITAFIFLAMTLTLFAQTSSVPQLMNYQGRLTKPDGSPVQDGSYRLFFRIYDQEQGGAKKWEQEMNPVLVRNGVFAVLLGNGNPLNETVFSSNAYLEVQLDTQNPMTPRQRIVSVAYAIKAKEADTVPDGSITQQKLAPGVGLGVPIGSVIAWWGDSSAIPNGWKLCDGSVINEAQSPLNGKTTPNLINRFIRGTTGNVITPVVQGGVDTINLAHNHIVDSHNHELFHTGPNEGDWFGYSGLQLTAGRTEPETNGNGHRYIFVTTSPNTTYFGGFAAPSTSSALSTSQSIVPSYVGLIYIVRVK